MRHLGMVDAADYMERELGYAPHTARERLPVASALDELPVLEAALARGELCFSAVKEVSRVATAETEQEWLDAVRGKSLRMVEELELSPDVYARLREARTRLADEDGHRPDDNALCDALDSDAQPGAARYQIAIQTCPSCERAWQDRGGRRVEIEAATLERARCDAQHIGSLDGSRPERATQTIPPATVRFVWRRDHGRCRVPGCRSSCGLELHHLVHRADGGTHEPDLLVLTCSSCHQAHHRGDLKLSGTAQDLRVERPTSDVGLHASDARLWHSGVRPGGRCTYPVGKCSGPVGTCSGPLG